MFLRIKRCQFQYPHHARSTPGFLADNLRSGFQGISLLLLLVSLWVNHRAQPRCPCLASRTSGPCQNSHACSLSPSVYSFGLEDPNGACLEVLLDEQGGYTSLRTLGREGPCPLQHPVGPSGPPKEELRQALPVWLHLAQDTRPGRALSSAIPHGPLQATEGGTTPGLTSVASLVDHEYIGADANDPTDITL